MKQALYGGPTILEWPVNLVTLALCSRCMWTDTHFRNLMFFLLCLIV
jgi:hypothetical protein